MITNVVFSLEQRFNVATTLMTCRFTDAFLRDYFQFLIPQKSVNARLKRKTNACDKTKSNLSCSIHVCGLRMTGQTCAVLSIAILFPKIMHIMLHNFR